MVPLCPDPPSLGALSCVSLLFRRRSSAVPHCHHPTPHAGRPAFWAWAGTLVRSLGRSWAWLSLHGSAAVLCCLLLPAAARGPHCDCRSQLLCFLPYSFLPLLFFPISLIRFQTHERVSMFSCTATGECSLSPSLPLAAVATFTGIKRRKCGPAVSSMAREAGSAAGARETKTV